MVLWTSHLCLSSRCARACQLHLQAALRNSHLLPAQGEKKALTRESSGVLSQQICASRRRRSRVESRWVSCANAPRCNAGQTGGDGATVRTRACRVNSISRMNKCAHFRSWTACERGEDQGEQACGGSPARFRRGHTVEGTHACAGNLGHARLIRFRRCVARDVFPTCGGVRRVSFMFNEFYPLSDGAQFSRCFFLF